MCVTFLFIYTVGNSQQQVFDFDSEINTLQDFFQFIEDNSEFTFSFNRKAIPLKRELSIDLTRNNNTTLFDLLDKIGSESGVQFDIIGTKIIVSSLAKSQFSGQIIDELSFESIIGATIYTNSLNSTITNINGYFTIPLTSLDSVIIIQNMGYETLMLNIEDIAQFDNVILLKSNLDFNIIITPDPSFVKPNKDQINSSTFTKSKGIFGNGDIIAHLKTIPGVSSGSEGQNGFTVRGGGPHQNLILLDGMPIYESSHLGGISSIFIPSAVKNIDFFKSGFNAKYGGRISSVLDVHLKDGNKNRFEKELTIGIEGLSGHIEGPLSTNTSININGKASWFSQFASPIAKSLFDDIEELDLNYNDIYAKVSHWFSPKNKISISGYLGNDLISLSRNTNNSENNYKDFNRISWGNSVLAFDWQYMISNDLFFNLNVGTTNYDYISRGSYSVREEMPDSTLIRSFDILSLSNINDIIINPTFEFYNTLLGKITTGIQYLKHNNEPSIIETERFVEQDEIPSIVDTTYKTDEFNFFISNSLSLNHKWQMNLGLRNSFYINDDKEYFYVLPRINFNYNYKSRNINISYDRLSQFTHLLSNPGLGLPSDLWVPSTSLVPPELSDNFSIEYNVVESNIEWGLASFYKRFQNLIEYEDVTDILYSIIIDNELFQIQVDNNSWEERVTLGKGWAYGIESFIKLKRNKWQGQLAYTFSRSIRQFESIDENEAFPYKYDRPHNIVFNLEYAIKKNHLLNVAWTYGTGNAYSLSDAVFMNPNGQPVLRPSSRNNVRLQAFHHLDIFYNWSKTFDSGLIIDYNLGIYNVYNQLNPFYEYLINRRDSTVPELVKIAIYPIIPQFNMTVKW